MFPFRQDDHPDHSCNMPLRNPAALAILAALALSLKR
jgi:hypothetical protein